MTRVCAPVIPHMQHVLIRYPSITLLTRTLKDRATIREPLPPPMPPPMPMPTSRPLMPQSLRLWLISLRVTLCSYIE